MVMKYDNRTIYFTDSGVAGDTFGGDTTSLTPLGWVKASCDEAAEVHLPKSNQLGHHEPSIRKGTSTSVGWLLFGHAT